MSLVTAYLFLYNVSQFLGWGALLYRSLPYITEQVKQSTDGELFPPARHPKSFYPEIEDHLKLIQTAALLEVVHAAIGLVRSNPVVAGVQILSRLAVVWIPIQFAANAQTSFGLTLVLLAWCLVEIFRYSYYAVNLINVNLSILTWMRYTLFIILYPMGVTGELWCWYESIAFWKNSKSMSYEMPNPLNFTFQPYVVTIMIMLYYIPGFPPMYFHMFAQRKKVLGKAKEA